MKTAQRTYSQQEAEEMVETIDQMRHEGLDLAVSEISLQGENSQLKAEIQHLKRSLYEARQEGHELRRRLGIQG